MKIVVAPDKFKGCLSAVEVAQAMTDGILAAAPLAQVTQCPLADGGDGTVDAVLRAVGGRRITRRVTGPLPEMKVDATFAMLNDGVTAVIEVAAASGLALLKPEDRNPLNTTTFGTGELITAAVQAGAKKIILGLGGSATVDAGIGCLQACGFTVLMDDGQPTAMSEPLCGRDVGNVLMVKHGRGEITAGVEIVAATDVTNPLTGPAGAARVFGPQKGATVEIVNELEETLTRLSHRTGTNEQAGQIGAGAAGGLAYAVTAFMHGRIAGGFQWIAELIDLSTLLKNADLCMTGEGQLDSQSSAGKVVGGVANLCATLGVPCIALAGSVAIHGEKMDGLTASFSICDGPMLLQNALCNAERLIAAQARNCISLFASRK